MSILTQIGPAVWLQILMCVVSLLFAARFAWRRATVKLPVLGALTAATAFATVASVCMGLAMVGRAGAKLAGSPNLVANTFVGVGEAMAGGMMGFATLTLIAILVAIGLGRQAR
jgi:hypothetical protein